MANREDDGLDVFLFSKGKTLVDLKCFRGDRPNISEQELRDQIHSAFMQKKMGRAKVSSDAPVASVSPINVRDFIASLAAE
jgi:hypothetical protein